MRHIVCVFLAASALAVPLATPAHGSWVSDITGVEINVPAGRISFSTPRPDHIPQMLQNLPKDLGQALLNPAGAALATVIRHGAAQAQWSSQPVPSEIRRVLEPFFPPGILNKARFTFYDPNRITIDSAITAWFQGEGAVTLDNFIVFSDANAASNWKLWAHELTHVSQYDRMGVESFATVYSVNWGSLEDQARAWAEHVQQTIQANNNQVPSGTFYAAPTGPSGSYLSSADYASAARQFFPAQSCTATRETPQALWVQNVCPVPVFINGWDQLPWGAQRPVHIACGFNCIVGPGENKPFQSPAPGPMVQVYFSYFSGN